MPSTHPSFGTVRTHQAPMELDDYDFRRATYEALMRAHAPDEHAIDAAFEALEAAHARLKAAHLARRARQMAEPSDALH